jgi:hypothetical protein
MSRLISKKRALLTAAVCSLTLVAVAIAYYTTLGEGTGTGTNGSAYATNLLIEGNVPAGLVPGATVNLDGEKVTNPSSNTGHARVTTIVATDIDVGAANESDACNDSWFTIVPIDVNQNLASGANTTFAAQITMANAVVDGTPVSQDACKGLPITIEWDSDATE